jgi:hypothetical protein
LRGKNLTARRAIVKLDKEGSHRTPEKGSQTSHAGAKSFTGGWPFERRGDVRWTA